MYYCCNSINLLRVHSIYYFQLKEGRRNQEKRRVRHQNHFSCSFNISLLWTETVSKVPEEDSNLLSLIHPGGHQRSWTSGLYWCLPIIAKKIYMTGPAAEEQNMTSDLQTFPNAQLILNFNSWKLQMCRHIYISLHLQIHYISSQKASLSLRI